MSDAACGEDRSRLGLLSERAQQFLRWVQNGTLGEGFDIDLIVLESRDLVERSYCTAENGRSRVRWRLTDNARELLGDSHA